SHRAPMVLRLEVSEQAWRSSVTSHPATRTPSTAISEARPCHQPYRYPGWLAGPAGRAAASSAASTTSIPPPATQAVADAASSASRPIAHALPIAVRLLAQ